MAFDLEQGIVERIGGLFADHGHRVHIARPGEAITALEHALQCAQLAEWADAEPPLVAAALLHDIGYLLAPVLPGIPGLPDDPHARLGAAWLEPFGLAVTAPVRLHVEAKRYLVRTDALYRATLPPDALHALAQQGGAMTDAELEIFEELPHAHDAIRLGRWDDAARQPGKRTPPLDYYLVLLFELEQQASQQAKTGIGATSVA